MKQLVAAEFVTSENKLTQASNSLQHMQLEA